MGRAGQNSRYYLIVLLMTIQRTHGANHTQITGNNRQEPRKTGTFAMTRPTAAARLKTSVEREVLQGGCGDTLDIIRLKLLTSSAYTYTAPIAHDELLRAH